MHHLTCLVALGIYIAICSSANAQVFDPTDSIGNQVDQNVSRTLQTESGAQVIPPPSSSLPPGTAGEKAVLGGTPGNYSGFSINAPPAKLFEAKQFLLQGTFNEKNSFLGMGVTDGYTGQIGLDVTSSFGTDIQPFVSYQHASRDLVGTTTYRADNYGGAINITQKLFPFFPGQPQAVLNLRDPTCEEKEALQAQKNIKDIFPNFDINLGLNLMTNSTGLSNLKKGTWTGVNQDSYGIASGPIFDFYFKRPQKGDPFSLMPVSVTVITSYSDQMINADNGTSGSNGLLSAQARTTYVYVLNQETKDTDIGTIPYETLELTQSNTFLHDTNQEPLTLSAGSIPYQNWAKFGLALAYRNKKTFSAKIEYTYETFNNQYEAHNVVASLNINF
jgi:hypothetical protein